MTKNTIEKFSPMWTNKQLWEFEQTHEDLDFDMTYVKPSSMEKATIWSSKKTNTNSDIRDVAVKKFDYLLEGHELWIAKNKDMGLDEQYIPYIMAVLTDIMIDEEVCLNFRIEDNCLVTSIDNDADVIDCKEFFEEFYHLATGFNYSIDTGIPDDETEAELYLTRLQEEFDERMKSKLGDKYLPGNNDPDSINSK